MTDAWSRNAHTLSRRTLLQGLGVSALSLAGVSGVTGCTGDSGPASVGDIAPRGTEPKGPLQITVFGVDQSYIDSFKGLFKSFGEQYPNVELQVSGIAADNWGGYFNTVSTRIAGGEPPDVVQVATEGQRLFASNGLATPIDPYLERDSQDLESFFNDVDENFTQQVNKYEKLNGNTYYLPGAFNTMCMWCNTDMFREAGAAVPDDDWAWEDFATASRKIKTLGSDVYPYAARNGGAGYFTGIEPWLLTNSANVLSEDWSTATMSTDGALNAVEMNRKMVVDKLMPGPGGQFDMFSAVAQGKVAMVGGGRWPIGSFKDLGFIEPLKIVAWPKGSSRGTPVGWNSYAIMKASENKEAAWAFVKFMTERETEMEFARGGGTVAPARESVATSQAFLGGSPEGTDELYAALQYASVIPSPNRSNELELTLTDGLEQILTGNISVEEGCKQLDEEIQSLLT